ncbi:MAG: hypothetical protein A3J82_04700 [Elusimicrobia bacterium RIFOXYA2_FULL_69_6]|nr:MAG: hypothetical protein A3J82_04700 [Elusimicrobia bacterium RIFOXYA2_FULL_69_6]
MQEAASLQAQAGQEQGLLPVVHPGVEGQGLAQLAAAHGQVAGDEGALVDPGLAAESGVARAHGARPEGGGEDLLGAALEEPAVLREAVGPADGRGRWVGGDGSGQGLQGARGEHDVVVEEPAPVPGADRGGRAPGRAPGGGLGVDEPDEGAALLPAPGRREPFRVVVVHDQDDFSDRGQVLGEEALQAAVQGERPPIRGDDDADGVHGDTPGGHII